MKRRPEVNLVTSTALNTIWVPFAGIQFAGYEGLKLIEHTLGQQNVSAPLVAITAILFATGVITEAITIKREGYTHNWTTTSLMNRIGSPLGSAVLASAIGIATLNVADGPTLLEVLRGLGTANAITNLEAKIIMSSLMSIYINRLIIEGKTEPLVNFVNRITPTLVFGPRLEETLSPHMLKDLGLRN